MTTDNLLTCELSALPRASVVHPSGKLTTRTYPQLRDFLLKCAADQPPAVVVDLDALEITDDYLVSVFVAAWMRISQWSTVPLAVVPGPAHEALFRTTPARPFLRLYPSVAEALDNLGTPAPRHRTELWLPPSGLSVLAAERFVADTCDNWRIGELGADAVAVAGKLVASAAERTTSPARLRLELWDGNLTVAVADDDPRPVRLPRPRRPDSPANGLDVVVRLARKCGCTHTQSGGKVVWAVLAVPPGN
ncbi:STAS domain-containing protein [Amycolatopsis sp. NPDC004378]